MPTAGVCDQRLGVCLRHLPKAGVSDLAHTALEIAQKVKDLVFLPFSAEGKHIYPYPHAIF